jgi:hypothetical protein
VPFRVLACAVAQAVHARRPLHEGARRVVANVDGEPCPHGVLGRPTAAFQVTGLQSELGYVGVMQGVANLFQNLPRGALEVLSFRQAPSGETSG